MKIMIKVMSAALFLFFSTSCEKSDDELVEEIIQSNLEEQVTLKLNQTNRLINSNLEIKLVKVLGDNRCPQNVACIWAGNVIISFKVNENGIPKSIEFEFREISNDETYNTIILENHTIKILGVTATQNVEDAVVNYVVNQK